MGRPLDAARSQDPRALPFRSEDAQPMRGAAALHGGRKIKSIVWLSVCVGLIVLAAANAHLLYVAVSSQPDCIAHLRHGEANGTTSFSAATSSCSSETSMITKAVVE